MNPLLSAIAQDVWRATWQGSLFIIAVFAICKCFRRIPASARHWLWWLACLQMPLRLMFISAVALPLLPAAENKQRTVEAPAQDLQVDASPKPVAAGWVVPASGSALTLSPKTQNQRPRTKHPTRPVRPSVRPSCAARNRSRGSRNTGNSLHF